MKENVLHILELTVSFETNIQINNVPNYNQIEFINLFLGALGTIGSSSKSYITLKSLSFRDKLHKPILSNLINVTVRSTYYTFCCRNKPWINPDLLNF